MVNTKTIKQIENLYLNGWLNEMFFLLETKGIFFKADDMDNHGREILDALCMGGYFTD